MIDTKHDSEVKLTKDIPYHVIPDKLWDVHCEDLAKNPPWYNSIALLYFDHALMGFIPRLWKYCNFAVLV